MNTATAAERLARCEERLARTEADLARIEHLVELGKRLVAVTTSLRAAQRRALHEEWLDSPDAICAVRGWHR